MEQTLTDGRASWKAWLPVVGLTFAAFVFNTSEFIPIGLLTDIANDFHTTEAHAGLLITVYAWVVALASLPLMLVFSRMEQRKLLLIMISLFIASHILSSVSTTYVLLMISRIGVACAHAVFWSIVSPMAVRVAPEEHRSTALSMIVTGTSIAMIVGLPLGRVIGLAVGWRVTFFYIAVAALAVFILLSLIFPKMPSRNTVSVRKLPALVRTPALWGIYVLTTLLVTAHYTGYSYIEPYLGQVAGLSDSWVTFVLTAFGLIGLLGSYLFSRYYDRHQGMFMRAATIGIAVFLLLLHVSSFNFYTVVFVCLCWGLSITFYNLVFQSEIIQWAPESTAIAMSIYSGIYNVGIGGGALIGGIVCTHLSMVWIGYVGGVIAIVAAVYCIRKLQPLLRKEE